MLNRFVAEIDKLLRWPAIWVLGMIFVLLALMFNYAIPYFTYTNPSGDVSAVAQEKMLATMLPEQAIGNMISGFPLFGGAIALILGVLVAGSEYGWSTFKTILVHRPGKFGLLSGKVLALAFILLIFVLVNFVFGALTSYVVAIIEIAPVSWPSMWDIINAFFSGWFILMTWGVFGVMLATLFRGTAMAIGLGLVYMLVVEGLIRAFARQSEILANLAKVLPGPNAGSLIAELVPSSLGADTEGVIAVVGGTQASFVLTAYMISFVLISSLVMLKRDVH